MLSYRNLNIVGKKSRTALSLPIGCRKDAESFITSKKTSILPDLRNAMENMIPSLGCRETISWVKRRKQYKRCGRAYERQSKICG
jgi:hypothetical protein